jgi:uncharacterized protein YggE
MRLALILSLFLAAPVSAQIQNLQKQADLMLVKVWDLQKQAEKALQQLQAPQQQVQPQQPPQGQAPKREPMTFSGEDTIRLVPDTGRLIVTIKSMGLKTPEAVLAENTNFSMIVSKLKQLGCYDQDIVLLKRDWNDDYKVVEIWGAATKRGDAWIKNGYAVYSTIDVSIREPKNLQAAIEVVTAYKQKIWAAGYSASNEEAVLKESTKNAYNKAMEQVLNLKLLGLDVITVGSNVELHGERISPALGISLQLKTKVKIHTTIPETINP